MTVGDVVTAHSVVLTTSYLDIQPSGTATWGIQNFYIPDGVLCEVYRTDGTNEILLYKGSTTLQLPQPFHATNSIYFRIKNVSGSSSYLGFDGRITKV